MNRDSATLGQHRSTQRKVPQRRPDEERLAVDIVERATRYGCYGYRPAGTYFGCIAPS